MSLSGSALSKKDVSMSEALVLTIMVGREEDEDSEGKNEKVLIGVVVAGRREMRWEEWREREERDERVAEVVVAMAMARE